jgi:hypothetical protein
MLICGNYRQRSYVIFKESGQVVCVRACVSSIGEWVCHYYRAKVFIAFIRQASNVLSDNCSGQVFFTDLPLHKANPSLILCASLFISSPRKFEVQEVDCMILENQDQIGNATSLPMKSIFRFQ